MHYSAVAPCGPCQDQGIVFCCKRNTEKPIASPRDLCWYLPSSLFLSVFVAGSAVDTLPLVQGIILGWISMTAFWVGFQRNLNDTRAVHWSIALSWVLLPEHQQVFSCKQRQCIVDSWHPDVNETKVYLELTMMTSPSKGCTEYLCKPCFLFMYLFSCVF